MFFRSLTNLGMEDPSNPEMELEEKINARRKAVGNFLNTLDTTEKFSAAMKSVNVAWGEVRSPENLRDQLTVKARGAITDIDDRNGGTRPITQSPYRFSAAKSGVRGPVAHRGENFDEVLKGWLSMNDQDISQLREDNVVIYDRKWRHH
jgi:crotonobetainyl-CoA:carnitine CoA-transferase CaiB-like acyl-CoA transferase